jgi:glycerol uptake facilitator-like aquaporin
MSDSFAGIRPADVFGFVAAQLLGALAATILFRWLLPVTSNEAENIILPHDEKQKDIL